MADLISGYVPAGAHTQPGAVACRWNMRPEVSTRAEKPATVTLATRWVAHIANRYSSEAVRGRTQRPLF